MTKPRQYTKDGQTFWRKKGYLGTNPLNGRQKNFNVGGFKTSKEAEEAFQEAKREFQKSRGINLRDSTFEEVYEIWMDQIYKYQVRESTLIGTQSKFNNYILPEIGSKKIDEISVDDIQNFANYMFYNVKHSNAPVFLNFISKVFNFAMKRKLVQSDPVRLIEKMKKTGSKKSEAGSTYLTAEEMKIIFDELQKKKFYQYVFYYLIFSTGARVGEVIALKWIDVDFNEKLLNIRHSRTQKLDYSYSIGATKNGKSRTVPLSDKTIELLNDWKDKQKELFMSDRYVKKGIKLKKDEEQLIFPNLQNNLLTAAVAYEWLKKEKKKDWS